DRDRLCSTDGCSEGGVVLDGQARQAAIESTLATTLSVLLLGGGTWLLVTGRPHPPPRSATLTTLALPSAAQSFGWGIAIQRSF
ncbi:MAG: hypothetical protein ABW061_00605, partial [Polyangiaceae bacterium]